MAGKLTDEEYVEEFQQLVEAQSTVQYEDQDPIMLVYLTLADMVVMCTRLYISLRAVEDNFNERMKKYVEEHGYE